MRKLIFKVIITMPFIMTLFCIFGLVLLSRLVGAFLYNLTDFMQYNSMYFDETSDSYTGELISNLVKKGADTAEIKELLKSVLNEAFYTILMGLDGEASLGDMQMQFSIYDEDNVLIDDIESYAYDEFMSDM